VSFTPRSFHALVVTRRHGFPSKRRNLFPRNNIDTVSSFPIIIHWAPGEAENRLWKHCLVFLWQITYFRSSCDGNHDHDEIVVQVSYRSNKISSRNDIVLGINQKLQWNSLEAKALTLFSLHECSDGVGTKSNLNAH
jgi:hypothetical protein